MSEKVERTDDMPVSIFKPEEKYDEKHVKSPCNMVSSIQQR